MRVTLRFSLTVAAAALAALTLLTTATSAPPDGKIVVRGANLGSRLKLTVKKRRIVVRGHLAAGRQVGCRVVRKRLKAACPLRRVDSIELRMGPSGDMVEVLDRLPIPLTVYLGDGSDKFIGNGERDTCYPQGARRNRCVGAGGNDVCITGQKNSDCVGGPGNDYCRHGPGSDGCWGGPGHDVCVMGPGQDGCHGDGGNDRLYGGPSPDRLYGGRGFDHCDGGQGWGHSDACEAGPRR